MSLLDKVAQLTRAENKKFFLFFYFNVILLELLAITTSEAINGVAMFKTV
jgi:hypothetical protein